MRGPKEITGFTLLLKRINARGFQRLSKAGASIALRVHLDTTTGFTLLELIVTFTILSLIMVVILGALRLGSGAWERGEERTERYQKGRIVFNLLSQQVKSSFPYKVKAKMAEPDYLAFLGERDSLRFVSAFSLVAKRPEGLVFVIYRVVDGKPSEKVLRVYEKRVLNKYFMEEMPAEENFLSLMEDLSDLRFEYFQEGEKEEAGEWLESWDGKEKKELPRQVRIVAKWKERKDSEMVLPTLVSLPAYRFDDRGKPGMVSVPTRTPSRPR